MPGMEDTGSVNPRVIALHASASSSNQWRALRQRLGANFDVVTPDLIGHGRRGTWCEAAPPGLDDDAAQIASMVPGAGHLIGHSFGGVVALKAALAHPRHMRSLVLYEPVLFALLVGRRGLTPEQRRVFDVADHVHAAAGAGDLGAAARTFMNYWSGPGAWERMDSVAQTTVAQRMPVVAGHFDAIATAHDVARGLAALSVPTLLLCGSETTESARCVTELAAAVLPNARLAVIPGAGHMGPVTHERSVNDQIAGHLYANSA